MYKTTLITAKAFFPYSKRAFEALPEEAKQAYGENYLKEIDESFYQTLEAKANPKIEDVVDAYHHAITSRFPKLRYAIGLDANFLYVPSSILPTWLQDILIRLMTMDPVPDSMKKNKSQ